MSILWTYLYSPQNIFQSSYFKALARRHVEQKGNSNATFLVRNGTLICLELGRKYPTLGSFILGSKQNISCLFQVQDKRSCVCIHIHVWFCSSCLNKSNHGMISSFHLHSLKSKRLRITVFAALSDASWRDGWKWRSQISTRGLSFDDVVLWNTNEGVK